MKSLRGVASKVSHVASVQGTHGGNQHGGSVSTSHISTFSLSSQVVRFTGRQPAVINEGDDIVVVGNPGGNGIFGARTYANLTNGVSGGGINSLAYRAVGWLLILGAVVGSVGYLSAYIKTPKDITYVIGDGGWIVILIGAAFAALGFYVLREARLGTEAVRLFEAEVNRGKR